MVEFGGFNVYFNASPSNAMFTFVSITFLCITIGIDAVEDNGKDCTDFSKDLWKSDKQQLEDPLNFEEKFTKSQQNPWHSANSSKKAQCLVKSEPSEDPQQIWGAIDKMKHSIKKEVLLDEVKVEDLWKSDKQQPEDPLNFEEKFTKSQQNQWHSANSSKKAQCLVKSEPSEDPQQFWGAIDKMKHSIKKEVLLDEVKVEKIENFDDWTWHDGTIRAETVKVEQQNVSVGSEEEQQKGSDEHTSAGLMEESSSAERNAKTSAFRGAFSQHEKCKIIKQFNKLKEKFMSESPNSRPRNGLNDEAKRNFGISYSTINQWKSELGFSRKKKIYSQNEKRRLIEKFEKLRTEFLAKRPTADQLGLDDLIKQKLGISSRTITYWKSELGLTSQIRRSQTERNKIIKLFEELRDQNPHIGNKKLVKMLKTSDRSLARWKKELNAEKTYSITDKQKMIKKFGNLKKNYMAKPQKTKKPMQEIEEEIARELGLTRGRIYAWKKKLGLSKKSIYTEAEKKEVVKQYFEIQRENPKMSITEIAKALGVCLTSIRTWKKQFATFVNGSCAPSSAAADALLLQESSGLLPPFPNADNNKWKWNSSTKRRTPNE
uniref:Homeobox domain-containing protein n=1 Tax=Globodera rostochiensis TaxID=31243 RepID=A0A914HZS2_GLORO